MPSFYTVATGNTGAAQDVDQLVNALNGTAGQGVPIAITGPNDSVNFALVVKNNEATNSRAFQVLRANNAVLIQADVNGVVVSPDGVSATAQVVNLSMAQTLTNKTLTAPIINTGGLTITAGDLAVTAGKLTFGAAASQIVPGVTSLSLRNNANNADNLIVTDAGAVTIRNGLTISAGAVSLGAGSVTGSGTTTLTGTINLGASATTPLGFYGHTNANQVAIGAAATDLASVITLANNIRTALQGNGLCA